MQILDTLITLDLYDYDKTPAKIKTIQLDSQTRYVDAIIQDKGVTYDIGESTTVTLTVIRPDKTGVQITGQTKAHVESSPTGEAVTTYGAYAEFTPTALAAKGNLRAQFMFTSGEQILRTEIFTVANGEALDASTDTWAGEYQGYNLDELVQNVNESVAKVDAMEDDVSELKSGFDEFAKTGESVIYSGTVSGARTVIVDVNITAGTYNLHIDNISSSDTDSDKSMIQYRYESGRLDKVYERGVEIDSTVTFTARVVQLAFLAASTLNESAGDSFTYSGVKLYTELFAKKKELDATKEELDATKEEFTGKVSELRNGLNAMQNATSEDVGKALKAKTVADGKVTEWEFGEISENAESIINYDLLNILKRATFESGYLNNTNGSVQNNANYQTSDFIPIDGNIVYVLKNVARYCAYDENKEYPSAEYGDNKQTAIFNGRSYLRISVLNSNIDNVFICEGEKYYPNEAEADSQPQNINVMGDNFVPKMLSEIANIDDNRFVTGKNLFNISGGYVYVLGTAQRAINENTGAVNVNATQFKQNLDRKYNSAVIPVNGCIASTYFIPVQSGKYMFANYSYWLSAAYDSDKNFIQSIPKCPYAFTGYLIPEGVSYVRLNFYAQTDGTDNRETLFLHSVEEVKNIMVWQEDEAVCTRPATAQQKQIDGSFVSPNYLDKVVPNMIDSDFLSAMKCMTVREINRREHAWRFGNFNAYVGSDTKGYYLIRKMLMDNGVDFCGFEEMSNRATDIGTYLKSWQFADGFVSPKNDGGKGTNALSIVSRFEVQTWNAYTMTTVSGNKDCINARIRLPRYTDAYNPFRILSMYVIHPMVGADQQSLANELLSIIANDDSDYVVITSDTNSFGDTEESKVFWRVLEAGGFRPTIPITTKTVTQDNLTVGENDPSKEWRAHSIDQIFISSNIDCVSYNVINTKDEYIGFYKNNTTTDGEFALSDHDFVYADLVFKDETRQ